jgi:LPS-assembly protein
VKNVIRLLLIAVSLVTAHPALALSDEVDPAVLYKLCGASPRIPKAPSDPGQTYVPGTTVIWADHARAIEGGLSNLQGNVEVLRDENALRADAITYDKPRDLVNVKGNVHFWDKDIFWLGRRGYMFLGDDKAYLEDGSYRLLGRRGNGTASFITTDRSSKKSYLKQTDYTTCEGKDPAWKLSARVIKLNHKEEIGQAKDVVLRVADVPVFYWPYASFPLSNKRKSGFLIPTFGFRSRAGADITIPYYLNLAPEMDATLSPRILSDRGLMLGGQFRYLLRSGRGEVNANYLPSDSRFGGRDRHLIGFRHEQTFSAKRLRTRVIFNDVSDETYFEDFGAGLSLTSLRFLERRADITYSDQLFGIGSWHLSGRVQSYQTVDSNIPEALRPYDRLPQIHFAASIPNFYRGLSFALNAQTSYFEKSAGPTGARIDLQPTLSYPIRSASGFIEPRVSLRHTMYMLSDNPPDSNPTRTLPILSLDSGLFFERELRAGNRKYLQTFEPRAYYLFIPRADQRDIPIFDTGQYDISFARLFRDDRFSGPDRVGDANQIAVGLTSRIIDRGRGWERFRASVGELFYFQDRETTIPRRAIVGTDPFSELVGELSANLTEAWSMRGTVTWDPNNSSTRRATVGVRYRPDPYTVLNLGYRRRTDILGLGRTDIEQTDISMRYPLTPNWGLIGRWNYSLNEGETVEAVAGLEYNSCCWGARLVSRRYISTANGLVDNGIFLQVELKGLAGFGRSTTTFLKRSIPGYRNEF